VPGRYIQGGLRWPAPGMQTPDLTQQPNRWMRSGVQQLSRILPTHCLGNSFRCVEHMSLQAGWMSCVMWSALLVIVSTAPDPIPRSQYLYHCRLFAHGTGRT
jgi:hypothetical protein